MLKLEDILIEDCVKNQIEHNVKKDYKINELDIQKTLAQTILNEIRQKYPFSIIAGGAPRDWYFNQEALDIDIYIYIPNSEGPQPNRTIEFENLLNLKIKNKNELIENYCDNTNNYNNFIKNIYQIDYMDLKFDLIICQDNFLNPLSIDDFVKKIFKTFDIGLCMIYYNNGQLIPSEQFKTDFINKTITCFMDNIVSYFVLERTMTKRIPKLSKKFPNFSVKLDCNKTKIEFLTVQFKNYNTLQFQSQKNTTEKTNETLQNP